MVYKFKVLSDEDEKFFMDIEILSNQTFYDFHDLIQEELEYDRSHLASFFVASHSWRRLKEIPLIAMDNTIDQPVTMEKAVLTDYVKDAHQKFIYLFDYINDRCFFIELIETKPESPNMYYPVCTDFGGEIPPQIGKKDKKTSIFDDDEDSDISVSSFKKSMPILDDEVDDITDISLDKDLETPIDAELQGEFEEDEFEDSFDDDLSFEEDGYDDSLDNFDKEDDVK